jgi:UDP-3-O-[3-hydroxymyristoyl] glucosamine N-acyltransferase
LTSPLAIFVPADAEGTIRPIELGDGCQVGPFAVIFGGTRIGNGARVEEHVIAGHQEQGYAVGHVYPGAGAETVIEAGAVIRAGAIIYGELRSARIPWSATTRCCAPSSPSAVRHNSGTI